MLRVESDLSVEEDDPTEAVVDTQEESRALPHPGGEDADQYRGRKGDKPVHAADPEDIDTDGDAGDHGPELPDKLEQEAAGEPDDWGEYYRDHTDGDQMLMSDETRLGESLHCRISLG